MAYKSKSKRRYGKKKGMRRGKRPITNVNRAIQPFAQRYICKMKYSDSVQVTGPGLAGLAAFRFNLNSIFDPNQTGTGHQPYGHDTLSILYNRYRVISCKYVISAIATGGTSGNQYSIVAALPANESVNVTGGINEVQENPRCNFITQAPSAALKVLKGTVHLPSLMGRTKSQYMADDRYQATYGTSPNEFAILNVYAGLLNGAAETSSMQLNVMLEYTVESFDVKNLSQS